MSGRNRGLVAAAALLGAYAVGASPAHAEWEVSAAVGGLSGGDLNAVDANDVRRSFESAELYGGRLAWVGYPVGVEVGYVTSPSGLSGEVALPPELGAGDTLEIDTRVGYGELHVFVAPLPGLVTPVLAAGIGVHTYEFAVANLLETRVTKLGYSFGGGLRIHVSRLTLRADIRDHVTTIGLEDFGLGALPDVIGIEVEDSVHNVEISVGIGLRF